MIDTRHRNLALLVASCFFMENLDGTIVTTAAPRIGADLHVASAEVGLVITAYLITLAVLIPLSGWMVERFGTKKVFLSAIALFTLASLLCASSVNLGELVAMRVVQGAGGAMMVPVGRLAVLSRTDKVDMLRVMSYIVWPGLLAPVVAPLLGGVITTYASWRWLFLINIPLGLAAFAVAVRLVPSLPSKKRPPPLDWAGVLLTCTGLGGVTYTAHLLSATSTEWATVAAVATVSLCLVAATARHLLVTPNPLVDLQTLRTQSFRAAVTGGSLFWVTIGAVPFLLPLLFENIFGWSAIKSGSVVLFVFVGNIGIKPATSFLLNRFGFRRVLLAATAGAAATMVTLGLLDARTPLAVVIAIALLSGVARSVGLTAYSTLSFSDIAPEQMGHANSLAATAQQLSAGLGIAAAAVALRLGIPFTRLWSTHPHPASAYTAAFAALALVALEALVGAFRLPGDAGDALRKPTISGRRSGAQLSKR